MRRSFRFLALLACALPLACSDSGAPTGPAPVRSPVARADQGDNGAIITRGETVFPFDYIADAACVGEPLHVWGSMLNTYKLVQAPSGAFLYMEALLEPRWSVAGVNSGTVWQLSRSQVHVHNFGYKSARYLVNENDWYQNDNLDRMRVQWLLRLVWNANGELVMDKMNIADCQVMAAH